MELFGALYRALTGRSPGGEAPSRLRSMLNSLEKRHGGVKAAAGDTGVSESTWRRWKRGQAKPRTENLKKVQRSRRRAMTDTGKIARARTGGDRDSGGGGLTVTGWVTVSRDTRHRSLNIGRTISAERMDALLTAWFEGEAEEVEVEMQLAVGEYIGGAAVIEGAEITF